MKKKIKIKIINFGNSNLNGFKFDEKDNFFIDILSKYFDIELSDDPDYIIYSNYKNPVKPFEYNGIRIYWMSEYVEPDFNVCDYAFGLSHCTFEDRYFRYLPYYFLMTPERVKKIKTPKNYSIEDLKKKKFFCGFVHANAHAPERNRMYKLLCNYKQVSSGGRYMNNMGYFVDSKKVFFSECKFAMVFENSYGYDSDRLVECFEAGTIPIYWGDPNITKEFNEKAFICVHNYESYEAVVEDIKRIDNDDELYLQMLNQPKFRDDFSLEKHEQEFEEFLVHIFEQPFEEAYRRNRNYWGYIAERVAYSGAKCRRKRLLIWLWAHRFCKVFNLKKLETKFENKLVYYR